MALDRLVSMGLRASELVFAAIVAGVTGDYLHHTHAGAWHLGRFIYTEVVAGLSIFLALLWLIPFSSTFVHWPVDIFISVLWWVVFGLLVDVSINHLQPRQHADSPSWSAAAAAPSSTGATSPPRRPVRQVQGRHRLRLPVGHSLARLGPRRLLLGSEA